MRTIPFLPEYFETIAAHIQLAKPIILPTESCYGFSGSIDLIKAITQTEQIKGRSDKPFIVLVESRKKMAQYADTTALQETKIFNDDTQVTTFILPKKKNFPPHYFEKFSDIGIRKCTYKPLQGFLHFFNAPIFSTSANISGHPPIYTEQEIKKKFSHIPNLLFVSAGDLEKNNPSQIVKMENNELIFLRKS